MVDELAKTHLNPSQAVTVNQAPSVAPAAAAATATRRATVLPRVEWSQGQATVLPNQRDRYEEVDSLGQGGMGEVVLVRDHDIDRTAALKRLPPGSDLGTVLRFAEEIRTIGQLDHPNIVPVHDVGVDSQGRYYFVMKHLRGETLEALIERLKAGDAQTHARFPFAVRLQVFLGVLNAVAYAHHQGFLHRDLKPGNLMVGPYGEVTVMDWGLSKQLRATASGAPHPSTSSRTGSALATHVGAIMGTPLFMSPEQARGAIDELDQRSDTYALTAIFHEWIFLEHYLAAVAEAPLPKVLDAVQTVTVGGYLTPRHRAQSVPPAELGWYCARGLSKALEARFQSVDEMIAELQRIIDGRVHIQCPRTLLKRSGNTLLRLADSHPLGAVVIGGVLAMLGLGALVTSALYFLR